MTTFEYEQLPPRVREYVRELTCTCEEAALPLVSVIAFGSAVTGGFVGDTSDVDMIFVLADDTGADASGRVRKHVERLEEQHGLRDRSGQPAGILDSFAQKVTANVRSFFICTRSDPLSGDVARLLGISRSQAVFVDRVVIPSIIASAVTVRGEDLLPQVPVLPIRRLDVFKAFFSLVQPAASQCGHVPGGAFVNPVCDGRPQAVGAQLLLLSSCASCQPAR